MFGWLNWRVVSFFVIAIMPLWMPLVSILVVMAEQKLGLIEKEETKDGE